MINHARTLLMNSASAPISPGEEYILDTYVPFKLPRYLQNVWNVLYGDKLERKDLNYRTRQLITFLHSTELVKYVTALDPRITYWPILDKALWQPEPTTLNPLTKLSDKLAKLNLEELFNMPGEHYEEFLNNWQSPQLLYKLSGLSLAFIYQVEEMRQCNGKT